MDKMRGGFAEEDEGGYYDDEISTRGAVLSDIVHDGKGCGTFGR